MFVKNTGSGSAWLSGTIIITKIKGSVSYAIMLNNSHIIRKQVDHKMNQWKN